jgi:hypothetical protein
MGLVCLKSLEKSMSAHHSEQGNKGSSAQKKLLLTDFEIIEVPFDNLITRYKVGGVCPAGGCTTPRYRTPTIDRTR